MPHTYSLYIYSTIVCIFYTLYYTIHYTIQAYFGDSHEAVSYFTSLGHTCPEAYNPSDYFLDILSPDNRTTDSEVESHNRIQYLTTYYTNDNNKVKFQAYNDHINLLKANNTLMQLKEIKSIGHTFTIYKRIQNFTLLAWRAGTEQRRDTFTIAIKLTFTIVFSLIIGGIYSHIGKLYASLYTYTYYFINYTYTVYYTKLCILN